MTDVTRVDHQFAYFVKLDDDETGGRSYYLADSGFWTTNREWAKPFPTQALAMAALSLLNADDGYTDYEEWTV